MGELIAVPYVLPAYITDLRTRLAAALGETVTVVTQVPSTRPSTFVRLVVTNTSRLSLAHAEVVVVHECWARSEYEAGVLSEVAYPVAASTAISDPYVWCPPGSRGTVYGPYPSDDPTTGTPRSVFAVSLLVAAEAI